MVAVGMLMPMDIVSGTHTFFSYHISYSQNGVALAGAVLLVLH